MNVIKDRALVYNDETDTFQIIRIVPLTSTYIYASNNSKEWSHKNEQSSEICQENIRISIKEESIDKMMSDSDTDSSINENFFKLQRKKFKKNVKVQFSFKRNEKREILFDLKIPNVNLSESDTDEGTYIDNKYDKNSLNNATTSLDNKKYSETAHIPTDSNINNNVYDTDNANSELFGNVSNAGELSLHPLKNDEDTPSVSDDDEELDWSIGEINKMADAVELNLIGKTNVDMNFDAINDTLSISDDESDLEQPKYFSPEPDDGQVVATDWPFEVGATIEISDENNNSYEVDNVLEFNNIFEITYQDPGPNYDYDIIEISDDEDENVMTCVKNEEANIDERSLNDLDEDELILMDDHDDDDNYRMPRIVKKSIPTKKSETIDIIELSDSD